MMPTSESLRKGTIGFSILVLLATFPFTPNARATLHENLPLEHWAYPVIDELMLRGYGGELLFMNRPYTRGQAAELILEVREAARREGGESHRALEEWTGMLADEFEPELEELRGEKKGEFYRWRVELGANVFLDETEQDVELDPAFLPIREEDEGDPSVRAVFPPGFGLALGEHLTVSSIAWIDTEMRNDPTARVKGDPKRPLRFKHSYIKYHRPHFEFLLGREAFRWGPGYTGGLVLGDTSPSLDAALLRFNVEWFTLTTLVSQLNDELPSLGEDTGEEVPDGMVSRYLYGHRLDMKFLPWLEFGFAETAVVTGVGRGFDLRFMNPFLSLYSTQHEGDRNQREVNLSHSLHWFVGYFPRITLYGELMIDEIILKERDEKQPSRPNIVGFLQGASVADPVGLSGWTLRGEYVRLNSFLYVHRGLNTDYEHFGSPLGHSYGPDTDETSVRITKLVNRKLSLGGGFAYRRRGEIRLDTAEESLGKESSFLQGVVERRRIYSASLRWHPHRDLFVKLDTSYIRLSNMGNVSGRSEGLMDLRVLLSYRTRWF